MFQARRCRSTLFRRCHLAHESLDSLPVRGKHGHNFGSIEQIRQSLGKRRTDAGGRFDGVGKLGRMSGADTDHRNVWLAFCSPGCGNTNGSVRIYE